MPNPIDEVHAHFLETKEDYTDEKGAVKKRTNVKCNHCAKCFVFRNVFQLIVHLAAPKIGMGKDSACRSVPAAVRKHYSDRVAQCEAEKAEKVAKEKTRVAVQELEQQQAGKKPKVQSFIQQSFTASKVCRRSSINFRDSPTPYWLIDAFMYFRWQVRTSKRQLLVGLSALVSRLKYSTTPCGHVHLQQFAHLRLQWLCLSDTNSVAQFWICFMPKMKSCSYAY
jgi:hypothetical protein